MIPTSNIRLYADVRGEFGPNTTLPNSDPPQLNDYKQAIFPSTGSSATLTPFGGTGQPVTPTASHSNVQSTSVTLELSCTDTGTDNTIIEADWYWEYGTDSNLNTHTDVGGGSSVADSLSGRTHNLTGLTSATVYYYRAVVYNRYNNADADRSRSSIGTFTTSGGCSDPTSFSAVEQPFGAIQIDWNSSYNPVNGWEIQYKLGQFGTWNVLVDNLSGSNRSYVHSSCGADYDNGDDVYYRIKAQCSGTDSGWVEDNTGTIANCK